MLIDEVDHIDVLQVVVSPKKHVFMAMEYMDHDFRALMESMMGGSDTRRLRVGATASTRFGERIFSPDCGLPESD